MNFTPAAKGVLIMPWKFLGFVVFLALLLFFIGFNLDNKCDISFGFTTLPEVPVYLTVFSAFMLGLFCTIPLILSRKFRKSKPQDVPAIGAGDKGGRSKKDRKKKGTVPGEGPHQDGFDGGPYGVN
jgi:uncharacterized integral membrane protein